LRQHYVQKSNRNDIDKDRVYKVGGKNKQFVFITYIVIAPFYVIIVKIEIIVVSNSAISSYAPRHVSRSIHTFSSCSADIIVFTKTTSILGFPLKVKNTITFDSETYNKNSNGKLFRLCLYCLLRKFQFHRHNATHTFADEKREISTI